MSRRGRANRPRGLSLCSAARTAAAGGRAADDLEFEEVSEEAFAFGGEDGFGVELDAVDGESFVLQAHDFAFGGFGGDFQDVGQGVAFDDERVVAGGFER